MRRILALFILVTIGVSACAPAESIWGIPQTPTLDSANTQAPIFDPFIIQDDPLTFLTSTPPIPIQNPGTPTSTPDGSAPAIVPTYTQSVEKAPFLYYAQSGDMLAAIANRFGVMETEISTDADLTKTNLIDPGTLLVIPNHIDEPTTPNIQILPDAEFVYSVTSVDFDIEAFVKKQGGYLSTFRDYLGSTGRIEGYDAIQRLAEENSVNPRLILALLEYESRWVSGQPVDILHTDYPMGFNDYHYKGMSVQLVWAINTMSIGYYGWRAGSLTHFSFPDGSQIRIDPHLNAGTVALQYLFSRLHSQSQWAQMIDPANGFPALYDKMFGDPWIRAEAANPLFPPALIQPPLVLPFEPGVKWSFTGGPHNGWGQINPEIYGQSHSVFAAIDFAPGAEKSGCVPTTQWAVAAAPGLVVRSENGAVMIDLDGDGYEQTGWDLLYMHMAAQGRVAAGTWVETNDHIGHPSCEGGVATGTHLHFARKYNGEWVTADGPIPFILSGWRVVAGDAPYKGQLIQGDQVVTADTLGQAWSNITRGPDE